MVPAESDVCDACRRKQMQAYEGKLHCQLHIAENRLVGLIHTHGTLPGEPGSAGSSMTSSLYISFLAPSYYVLLRQVTDSGEGKGVDWMKVHSMTIMTMTGAEI